MSSPIGNSTLRRGIVQNKQAGRTNNNSETVKVPVYLAIPENNSETVKVPVYLAIPENNSETRKGSLYVPSPEKPIPGTNDSWLVQWARKMFYEIEGEEGIRKLLINQFNLLSKEAHLLREAGFFPDKEGYREEIVGHQLPFFIKYFRGELTPQDMQLLIDAHAPFNITDAQFDQMEELIRRNAPPGTGVFIGPSMASFRPFIVTTS